MMSCVVVVGVVVEVVNRFVGLVVCSVVRLLLLMDLVIFRLCFFGVLLMCEGSGGR